MGIKSIDSATFENTFIEKMKKDIENKDKENIVKTNQELQKIKNEIKDTEYVFIFIFFIFFKKFKFF